MINILSYGVEEHGVVTSEMCNWQFLIYDEDNLISTILVWIVAILDLKMTKIIDLNQVKLKF